ncbi:MAG: CBS domain-containing protein [Chloroflexi bacterium]|nr:CBS domain-containing protein [Chloroflexota bacterium]MCI0889512.1 CBS domain-containing protein [Chloroflexota bacterium]
MKIESILATKSSNVYTVGPDRPLREAVDLLAEHNIGALIVVDEPGRPIGIISERDIIREAAQSETVFSQPVSRVMTKDLITASPDDDLETVLQTMTANHCRHLPIMDRERLIAVLSIGDVVKAQLDKWQGEVDTLQTQIIEGQA